MKANPDKFQAIAIGKRTFEKSPVFELKGSIFIECEEVVKLLGIDIDYQLKFDKYINNLGDDHLILRGGGPGTFWK